MRVYSIFLCLASLIPMKASAVCFTGSLCSPGQVTGKTPSKATGPADVAQLALDQKLHFALKLTVDNAGAQMRPEQQDYFSGMLAFHEGHFEEARQHLSAALNARDTMLTSEQKIQAFETLGRNARLTGNFAGCAQMFEDIDKIWGARLGEADRDIRQNRHLCVAQMGNPPQTIDFTTQFTIQRTQGMYPVHVGNVSDTVQLDTGADETVLIESTAKKWGIVPSTSSVVMHGYSGGEFSGHPGVIPSLSIGTATLRNIPVLIVPDEDLLIAQLHLQIRVLLGLPVLQSLGSLTFLKHRNANGAHIYIRPTGESPYTLLDDLTPATLTRLNAEGYSPAAVVETSPGNFQAWLRHAQPLSKELGTLAAKTLAAEFHADGSAADWRRFGRAPGFTNRKPQHCNAQGLFPFARLVGHDGQTFPAAGQFHTRLLALQQQIEQQDTARRLSFAARPNRLSLPVSLDRFRSSTRYQGRPAAADMAFSIVASSQGWTETDIAAALARHHLSRDTSQAGRVPTFAAPSPKSCARPRSHPEHALGHTYAQRLDVSNGPKFPDGHSALYGWTFTGSSPNQIILLNLQSTSANLNLSSLLSAGNAAPLQQLEARFF